MGQIFKLSENEKWSVLGITTAMPPSPGAASNAHQTEKSVCVYVLVSLLVPATVSFPNRSVHEWDVVVFRGAAGKVAVAFKAQH